MDIHAVLTSAYGVAGAVGIAAYLPQAYALMRDKSGSKNIPLLTWGLWGAQTVIYVLYALFVVREPMFIGVMLGTFAVTHLCLWLLVYNRFFRKLPRNRRADDPRPAAPTPGEMY